MKSDTYINGIHESLKSGGAAKNLPKTVIQWNFTENGATIKKIVMDFKASNIYEGTTDSADGEVTVEDGDFVLVYDRKNLTFAQLQAEGKITVTGAANEILEHMDKGLAAHK